MSSVPGLWQRRLRSRGCVLPKHGRGRESPPLSPEGETEEPERKPCPEWAEPLPRSLRPPRFSPAPPRWGAGSLGEPLLHLPHFRRVVGTSAVGQTHFMSRWPRAAPMARSGGGRGTGRQLLCVFLFRGRPPEGLPCRSTVSGEVRAAAESAASPAACPVPGLWRRPVWLPQLLSRAGGSIESQVHSGP